eukprot:Hpha_TRINITY_DN16059_c3_g2::TRINITY_DN16059_c3_g2_i1::g.117199::m.117199
MSSRGRSEDMSQQDMLSQGSLSFRKKKKAALLPDFAAKGPGAAARLATNVRDLARSQGGRVSTPVPERGGTYSHLNDSLMPTAAADRLKRYIGNHSPVYAVRSVQKLNYKARRKRVILWVTPLYLVMSDTEGNPKRAVRLEDVSQIDIDDSRGRVLMTPIPTACDRPWLWEWDTEEPVG